VKSSQPFDLSYFRGAAYTTHAKSPSKVWLQIALVDFFLDVGFTLNSSI